MTEDDRRRTTETAETAETAEPAANTAVLPPPPATPAPAPAPPSWPERLRRSWAALSVAAAMLVAAGAGVGFAVGHHTASDSGPQRFGRMGPGGPGTGGFGGPLGGPPGMGQQPNQQQPG